MQVAENSQLDRVATRKRGRPMGSENMSTIEMSKRLERLRDAGALDGVSAKVLYALTSDAYWLKIIAKLEEQDDWRTIVDVLKFHQQMHEGRPAQRIHITSLTANFDATELANTRAVVNELKRTIAPALLLPDNGESNAKHASAEAGGKKGG